MEELVSSPPCAPHGAASIGICVGCERYCCGACYQPGNKLCVDCQTPAQTSGDPTTRAFQWIFKQEGWFGKLVLAGLMSLAGIVVLPAFAYMGLQLRIMRRAMVDPDAPLPGWDNFFALVGDGFRHLCALTLPILLLVGGFVLVVVGAVALAVAAGAPEELAILGIFAFYGFVALLALLVNAVQPAVTLEFLISGSLFAGFHFKNLWRHVADRFGDYLVLVLLQMVLNFLAGMVGIFTCYLGFFVSMPWAQFTFAHLVGRYVAEHYPEVARQAWYSEGQGD